MRVTSQHWEEFLSLAEKHPSSITSKFNGAQGKAEGNALWTSVATKLNALGLGEKSVAEWRRAVTDWKSKIKAKASKLRLSSSQTGGGPVNTTPLTPLEDKLLILMGKKCFEGDEGVKELGLMTLTRPTTTSKPDSANDCNFYNPASMPSSASAPNAAHNYGVGQIFKNTFQNLEDDSAPSTFTQPVDEEYEEEPSEEHNYCGKRKTKYQSCNKDLSPNAKQCNRYKRMKTQTIPRVTKHLEDMTSESVTVLKSIDKNILRIADSFDKLVKHFVEKLE